VVLRHKEHERLYDVSPVPDKYSMGEEKTLIKIFNEDKEKWVPRRVERCPMAPSARPPADGPSSTT